MKLNPKILFWLIVVCNVLDAVITAFILNAGGGEANPLMVWMLDRFGLAGMVYGKTPALLMMGVIVYGLWDRLSPPIRKFTSLALFGISALMVGLIIYSLAVYFTL